MIKTYGIWGSIILLRSWLFTRIFYSSAKLLLLPFDIRGGKYIKWGTNFSAGFGCRLEAYPVNNEITLKIGNNVQLQDYVHITATSKVVIGNDVLMASKIYISDTLHGSYSGDLNDCDPSVPPSLRPLSSKPVTIGNRVWLGEFVSVLPGVTIGEGTIIGANSVVSKNIPANVIAVGTPAKPIKKFNFETKRWEVLQVE
jgi:acetyltransferase-like isoleucine patch superfamily enzyme